MDKDKILIDEVDDTVIATTNEHKEYIENLFITAAKDYDPTNKRYSAFLKGNSTSDTLTYETLKELSQDCRNKVENVVKINGLIEKEITLNGIIGKTYEAIETNLNTDYKLTYKDFSDSKVKTKQLDKSKNIINLFNDEIEIETLMANSILNTYATGNEILYLRGDSKKGWIIDSFPLKVAIVSPYKQGNEPIILIDIKVLTDQLKKSILKLKSGKAMFFDTVEKEIKENYPEEVYKAYKAKENYAVLEPSRTYIMRINNLNKKYGISPIFKALEDNLMLQSFKDADRINAKARSKKILAQYLSDKLLDNSKTYGYNEMAFAHKNLLQAFKNETVITTTPSFVEKIEYVEPKVEMTDQKTYQEYKSSVCNALGVGFLTTQTGDSVATAQISLKQLMNTINAISRQFEKAMNKFYKVVLNDNGIKFDFLPKLTVIDAELMEFELRQQMSEYLFNRLNSSYETAYSVLGLDVEDEKQKRIRENENGYDDVFIPHQTSATFSSKNLENVYNSESKQNGRPKDKNSDKPDKQEYDKDYNDNQRV